MAETWTLADLVAEAKTRLEALPPPKNGQVRAVPDDRTVRYYASLGMLDRPAAMRGRTALYGPRHLAQIVAIKRMQSAGHSLAEIQQLWPTLDDATLMRVSGVELPDALATKGKGREFWKSEATPDMPGRTPEMPEEERTEELRIELTPGITLSIALSEGAAVSISSADIRALRAAAASLVTELANRGLTAHAPGTLEEKP